MSESKDPELYRCYGRVIAVDDNTTTIQMFNYSNKPVLNHAVEITTIARPIYVTGYNEDGHPVWDLSAPENL